MHAIISFFMRLDRRASRAVLASLALFALVLAVFLIGRFGLDLEPGAVRGWFERFDSYLALPATILIFTLLAFIGFPQFALIGAAVFAFGPVEGFIYSWIATMVSGTVNFWLARIFGADMVRRFGGQTVNRISEFVGKNGFWASFIVRIVPSAPFIVVNMAAGISQMSYLAFVTGMGLGVLPKTALVAFFGGGLIAIFAGGGIEAAAALIAIGILWIGFMLLARRWLRSTALGSQAEALKPDTSASTEGPAERKGDAET